MNLFLKTECENSELHIQPIFIESITATLMIHPNTAARYFAVCIMGIVAISHASTALSQDDTFYVFAIDKNHRNLESVEVRKDGTAVKLKQGKALPLPVKPTGLCSTPNSRHVIVTGRNDSDETQVFAAGFFDAQSDNQTAEPDRLRLRGGTTVSHSTGYTSVDRTGSFYLSADYRRGVVAAYRLGGDGVVGEETSLKELTEKSAHFIYTSPDNRFAYVPCVKANNAIFQFAFDQQSGKLTPLNPFMMKPPALFGPRHAAYHPRKPIVYFSNEQQLGISAYEISDDGQLRDIQHAATLPRRSPYVEGKRGMHASDIVISHDARWVFVAVRDFPEDEDSVFTFKVRTDGRLSLQHRTKVGDIPWKLSISPKGDLLLVSSVGDKKLSAFRINSNGSLSNAGSLDWGLQVWDMVTFDLK